jgi:hypothetical protein
MMAMAVKSPGFVSSAVYRQPNGSYAICFMLDGKPRFRTVDGSLDDARSARGAWWSPSRPGWCPPVRG